jgi:hypothetical protein
VKRAEQRFLDGVVARELRPGAGSLGELTTMVVRESS